MSKNLLGDQFHVLGLFDGMSVGRLALDRAGFDNVLYHAAEILEAPQKVAKFHFPDIQAVGDVRQLNASDFIHCRLILGGSPCQDFSAAGKRTGMDVGEFELTTLDHYLHLKRIGFEFDTNKQSYLFWEFVRLYREIKTLQEARGLPVIKFFLENVKMDKKWEKVISQALGVKPININSSRVTPQNRDRYYWTNINLYYLLEDQHPTLDSIIPNAVTGTGHRGREKKPGVVYPTNKRKPDSIYHQHWTKNSDNIAYCLTKSGNTRYYIDNQGIVHQLSPEHAELLQTLPIGYTNVPGVTETQRFEMLGNGWTTDVITYFFNNLRMEIYGSSIKVA